MLADHLPWAALVFPGVCLSTTGALMTTWRVRGTDGGSLTDEMLTARADQLNHMTQRYGHGWVLQWDAIRRPAQRYPDSQWPNAVGRLIDSERAALFADAGVHFATEVYLSLIFQTPKERSQRFWRLLYERRSPAVPLAYEEVLKSFLDEARTLQGILHGLFLEVEHLGDDQLMSYLHACVHPGSDVRVTTPRTPVFLSHYLADTPLLGGEEPMIGDDHLRLVTVKTWPHACVPGILAGLDTLPMAYRLALRWRPLDTDQAVKETQRRQKMWLQKRKGLLTMLREELLKRSSEMQNPEMTTRFVSAVECQQTVAEGAAALGELTLEILVWDASEARVTEKAIVVERTLSASGFTVLRERQHSVDAWLESMPGTTCGQVRSVLLTSQNLVDLAPAMQVWSGVERCPHLGTPLAFATTNTSTPFGLSLYQQDVGDTLVLGPKGSGKSMLLSFLGASWRRYRGAQVRFIEKGQSARCMTLAQQGAWIPFGADGACLQPLAYIDEDTERAWCADWVGWVLGREMSRPLQPDEKGDIWTALTSLAGKPARLRTLSALQILLQHPALRAALTAYTLEGPHGGLLDGDVDPLPDNPWWCFELGGVPESALPVVLPVLMHVVERRLTGAPTLILVDEAWAVLENLETWMRTFRKKNAVLVLATQAVLDIANSPLAHVIQEQAPTRIFLPNSHALEEKTMKAYQAWGLTEPQCHQIATALPKQHYYISCPAGSRVVDFEFGPVALAFGGHSRQEELQAMREIEPGPGWAPAWLRQQGLAWAAEALETEEELCGNR